MNLKEITKIDKSHLKLSGIKHEFRGSLSRILKFRKNIQHLEKIDPVSAGSMSENLYGDIRAIKDEIRSFLKHSNLPSSDRTMIDAKQIFDKLTSIENT